MPSSTPPSASSPRPRRCSPTRSRSLTSTTSWNFYYKADLVPTVIKNNICEQ
ncbi:hypothetical protein RHMOL_Rhmol10G0237200 [Rhododendron molle]|nr:hypothetical protein RHMOL_Rhmol10G0237200 [Rhododendron molle]